MSSNIVTPIIFGAIGMKAEDCIGPVSYVDRALLKDTVPGVNLRALLPDTEASIALWGVPADYTLITNKAHSVLRVMSADMRTPIQPSSPQAAADRPASVKRSAATKDETTVTQRATGTNKANAQGVYDALQQLAAHIAAAYRRKDTEAVLRELQELHKVGLGKVAKAHVPVLTAQEAVVKAQEALRKAQEQEALVCRDFLTGLGL